MKTIGSFSAAGWKLSLGLQDIEKAYLARPLSSSRSLALAGPGVQGNWQHQGTTRMCSDESAFQPAHFLLLVGVPVASALLLVQCLRWHCPRWLLGACWKLDSQEEPVAHPTPLPENESSRQCAPATLPEMAAFYQELHTPTQGQTIIRQLMHKLLVFSAREVDHRGGCLMLQDMGISLLIPPGNSTFSLLSLELFLVCCTRVSCLREHHS